MRALVTGGSGFVGANLARRLIADGHEVHLLLRPGADRWRLEGLGGFQEHAAAVDDRGAVLAAVEAARADWIFHLAAYGAYSFQADTAAMVRTNVEGTANMIEAAARTGCAAFINAGSSSEYGDLGFPPPETQPPNPNSNYAVTKVAATWLCRQAAIESGVPTTTLRLYSVYGRWEEPRRLMPRLLAHALRGVLPPLAQESVSHDFVYVDDVSNAFVLAASCTRPGEHRVYNIGTGQQTTLLQLVDVVRRLCAVADEPRFGSYEARSFDSAVWMADPTAAIADLGWRPDTELESGLAKMVRWIEPNLGRYSLADLS